MIARRYSRARAAGHAPGQWRSAFQLGAAYIFTIGGRNGWEKTADTYRSWRHIPAFRYADWGGFSAASPFAAVFLKKKKTQTRRKPTTHTPN